MAEEPTYSFLRGEIPQDVQDAVRRSTASQSIKGGFDIQSGMGRNRVARDLGINYYGRST
jgi:hypothetical protein